MFVEHSDIGKKTAGRRVRFSHCDGFLKIAKVITFTKATVKGAFLNISHFCIIFLRRL